MQGFLLGLSTGHMFSLLRPDHYTPLLLGEGKGIKQNGWILCHLPGGRLCGYLFFAILAWMTNHYLLAQTSGYHLFLGLAYVALAIALALYGLVDFSAPCAGRSLGSLLPEILRKRPALLPPLFGLITGLNPCPPFLLALASASELATLGQSLLFFFSFFLGTSLFYLIPIPFLGAFKGVPSLRTIGKLGCVRCLLSLSWNPDDCRRSRNLMNNTVLKPVLPAFLPAPKALLLSLPLLFLTALFLCRGSIPTDPLHLMALGLTYLFANSLFFLMVYTGKVYPYRSLFFTVAAFSFILAFISNLIEVRGSMVLHMATILEGETPFCHMVIPMIIIPAALTKTIIFPGSLLSGFASIASMLVLWLGASLSLVRGWCSWVCFFGGLDEGFSRLCKKPIVTKIDIKWTFLPYAVLLAVVLTSALTLSPTYCQWLCPFKAVTEFVEITSLQVLVQTIFFSTLFVGLVIALPVLTGRRTQCGLFCPFGAFQSFTNKLNIFAIRFDRDKCINCSQCVHSCPTFSLSEASVGQGHTLISCTKCGKCVDHCPKQAAAFHIKGTPLTVTAQSAKLLFLYPAFIFATAIGGGFIYRALVRLFTLMATGSMF